MFYSINPFTEQIIKETKPLSDSDLKESIKISQNSFLEWKTTSLEERISFLSDLKSQMKAQKNQLALLVTTEMGKPLNQAKSEIEKCLSLCDYMEQTAPVALCTKKDMPLSPPGSYVLHQALGVILGIMPWNFPVWQVMRFAVPALLAGNAVVVKHAPQVMGVAGFLSRLFQKAFKNKVYQNLPLSLKQTHEVIAHPVIQGVSLTGSVGAGKAIACQAGRYLKKTLLELGGSDPYIVLDDADLKKAAHQCVLSRMNNNGQSCIAAKRFIVTQKNQKTFTDLVLKEMNSFRMGDPLKPETSLGPLARKDLRDTLDRQVKNLKKQGAECLMGGEKLKQTGWFYPPTVLRSDKESVLKHEEELFGPTALILEVKNEEEALKWANTSPYGLGAAVFSQSKDKAHRVALQLQTGACAINQCLHSHPALPFGGVKNSGYGRELSLQGFYEFVNIKTIRDDDTSK